MKLKHLFMSVLAFAGILAVASCQQDDFVGGEVTGDYVDATFTVATPDGISTRAIGDGTTVNKLACAVYDADGEHLPDLYKIVDINGKTATYSTRLAKGQAYHVVFFAYNGKTDGTSDYYNVEDLKNVQVLGDQFSNVEERDAFTRAYHISAEESMNAISKEIYLKRPLAQLNIGIDAEEKLAAKEAGIVIEQSYVKVSSVYTCYNAFDSTVVGESTPVEFKMNTIPDATFTVDGKEYHYLALNYLLVGDLGSEKTLTDVEFQWTSANGKTNEPTTSFININTQRNYRTNIIGKLITNPTEFTVNIDETFDGEKNKIYTDVNGIRTAVVSTPQELQQALNEAEEGDNVIRIEDLILSRAATTVPEFTILQKEGVNLTIDGCGKSYEIKFLVNGNGRNNGTETLTFKDIHFTSNSTEAVTFIESPSKINGLWSYSHNITVDGCTFSSETYNEGIGAVNIAGGSYIVVRNCTATNIHSLLQVQSCDDNVTVDNVKTVNCKNGISFGNTADPTIINSNIEANGYGVRADGDASRGNLVIKNTTVNAKHPVTIRKVKTDGYSVALENATLNAGQLYGVIFTKNSEETVLEAPAGTFSITGAEKYNVYTGAAATVLKANNDAQLAQALGTEAETIELAAGKYVANLYDAPRKETLNIVGTEGTKLAFDRPQVRADLFNEVKISNCEILRMPNKSWGHLVFSGSGKDNGVYTLENCVFNGVGTQGIYINESASGATYNILNCTFNGDFGNEGAIVVQTNKDVNHNVNVQGCTFNNIPETSHRYYLARSENGFYYGWNFNTDLIATTAYELTTLANLGFTNIDLADGEYDVYGCAGKTLTLNGSKNAVIIVKNEGEDGCDYAFGGPGAVGNITFNGLTINTTNNTGNYKGFAYMKGTFNDCNFVGPYSLNNANDFVFKGCTFDFKNGYFWTWGAKSVKFDECTFNGNSKTILAHGYASTVITINNCNFAATEKGYTGAGDHTAAVEIDPAGSNTYTINFTGNNTLSDNYAGWTRVKDSSTGHTITGVE